MIFFRGARKENAKYNDNQKKKKKKASFFLGKYMSGFFILI